MVPAFAHTTKGLWKPVMDGSAFLLVSLKDVAILRFTVTLFLNLITEQCPLPEGGENTPVASGNTYYPSQLTKGAGEDGAAEHQCEYNKNNDDNDAHSCMAFGADGTTKIAAWDLYDCIPSGEPTTTSAGMCCPNRGILLRNFGNGQILKTFLVQL